MFSTRPDCQAGTGLKPIAIWPLLAFYWRSGRGVGLIPTFLKFPRSRTLPSAFAGIYALVILMIVIGRSAYGFRTSSHDG